MFLKTLFIIKMLTCYYYSRMNTCPQTCDGCGATLYKPYKMPCLRHFVGQCCRELMFQGHLASACPVDNVEISPEFDWSVDKNALNNR